MDIPSFIDQTHSFFFIQIQKWFGIKEGMYASFQYLLGYLRLSAAQKCSLILGNYQQAVKLQSLLNLSEQFKNFEHHHSITGKIPSSLRIFAAPCQELKARCPIWKLVPCMAWNQNSRKICFFVKRRTEINTFVHKPDKNNTLPG